MLYETTAQVWLPGGLDVSVLQNILDLNTIMEEHFHC